MAKNEIIFRKTDMESGGRIRRNAESELNSLSITHNFEVLRARYLDMLQQTVKHAARQGNSSQIRENQNLLDAVG